MKEKIIKSKEFHGKELSLESGHLAQLAHGAVLARQGDTAVLATVVTAAPREDIDYFPLSVEYEEKLYAGGIIKGSRWVKREGRPTDQAILNARLIDRSIRPLFPKSFNNEVQVIVTVLSVDEDNDPVILGVLATSAAITISGIPWNGPVAATRIGFFDNELVANPADNAMDQADMNLVVSSTMDHIVMVEMGGNQVAEEVVLNAFDLGFEHSLGYLALINEFAQEVIQKNGVGYQYQEPELTPELEKENQVLEDIKAYVDTNFPNVLLDATSAERDRVQEEFIAEIFKKYEGKTSKSKMHDVFEKVARAKTREKILATKKRVDGRDLDEVRPITSEVGLFPRTHGSGVFKRGDTQVLTVATLGSMALEQLIEDMRGERTKRYIHHYNFPPYSTGETGRVGSPKRREIGHGALAERALEAVIPSEEVFPYTIRLVSEVMASNGSTSMASVCGSTLALMDAGVPITEPVSGIAMGLIKEGDEVLILSDIMGIEDFYGDMDFKVAGTKNGINALQMDVKITSITKEILKDAIKQGNVGRMHILNEMLRAINSPRQDLSKFAPKIKHIKINPKKIGDLIGPGGKVIRSLQETTGTEISVDDDGTVIIHGVDEDGLARALEQVDMLTKEVQAGEVYKGKVTRILDFGAFVQILPGQEGLVHISELAPGFVKDIHAEVEEGQEMEVKVIEIDNQGRINLSRKAVLADQRKESNTHQSNPPRPDHTQRSH